MDVQRTGAAVQVLVTPSRLLRLLAAALVASAVQGGCATKDEAPSPPGPTGSPIEDPTTPRRPGTSPVYEPVPSPPGARPKFRPGGATDETPLAAVAVVTGGPVSSKVIAGVVREHLESFRPCAIADAKVELRLTLGPAGSVASAEAPRSQPDDARLRDCVVDAVRALRFPRDPGSDTSVVSFELVLTRPPF